MENYRKACVEANNKILTIKLPFSKNKCPWRKEVMKSKTFNKLLEKRAKEDRKEKAKREALKKYNYNKYINNYQKLIDKEYSKLTRKNIFPKLLIASIITLILIYYLTPDFQETINTLITKL
ncbi:hypothetical protein [Robinsoniella peoriensis]|uniref:hypothetical protein n=1 Tax=Robinsoniella peoriensis TaxID=180332 RepID=UPI003637D1A6